MTYSECKKIAFAEKKEEWEFLFEYKKTSEPDLEIIAVTPEVDFCARFHGKQIGLTVEDFYTWEEICNYGDLNITIIEDLTDEYDRILQEIGHNYPRIQWVSARAFFHTLKGFLDSLVLRTIPVYRVFQKLKPIQVFCFIQEDYLINGPGLLHKPSYSLTARIVPLVAQKCGCSITWIADEQQTETSRIDPRLTTPSTKQDELERRIDEFRITLHQYETIFSSKIESNPVLISDNGVDDFLSRITEIWHANNGGFPDFKCNNILTRFNLPAVRELGLELGKQIWSKINESSAIKQCFHIEDIDLYSLAQPLLQRLTLVDIPSMLTFAAGLEYSMKGYSQAVILLGGIECQTYVIAKCANDLGIPMVSIHKGGYMGYSLLPMHERYDFADCDYFICNGTGAQRTFQTPCELAFWRKDRKRAIPMPLGAIWLDALVQKNRESQKRPLDANGNCIIAEKKTIMYVMSALLGDNTYLGYVYHPEIWYIRFQMKLIDRLRKHPEIRILIKPPLPGRYPQICNPVIDWLKEQKFPNVTILENIPLEDVMHQADAFIVDSPSTPLLQLLTTDKPMIVYADSHFFKMTPAAVESLRKRVIYIDNEQQFYEEAEKFIKKANWTLPEPINIEFLREYGTYLHDGKSAERIVDFLMSLAKNYKKEKEKLAMVLNNIRLIKEKIKKDIAETRTFLPTQLSLETVCGCNAKCIMCPSGSITRSKGIIKTEVHRIIIDKVAAAGAPINFITHAGMGEPLLDPLLEERIQYEKRIFPNAKVAVYSNGSLLDEKRAINLIESGLDILSFSVNAYRPETYEQVMHLPRERTYCNIERFLELNRKAGSPVTVHISLIKTDICTNEEVAEFRSYWNAKVNAVIIPPVINWGGKLNIGCQRQREQLPCFYIWKVLMVDHDGTVKMCCEDYDSKYPLGNLLTQSLEEIFNSLRMIQQRDEQLQGRFTYPDICRHCVETFEIAEDFWQNGLLVPAPNRMHGEFHIDAKKDSIQEEERALISKIRSMDQEKYKRFLGIVLSEGLRVNSFDYPQGVWPPPTPARMYIAEFLTKYSPDVRGRCVEFYPAVYYKMFMENPAITAYDVWNVTPVNGATVFGDLQNAASISENTFDTIICTHVLSAIPNTAKAVSELRRILSPGGLVLCTVPCILQKYAPDPQDFWRFTRDSLKEAFSQFSRFELCSFGNAAAVAGSPYFLMTNHFPEEVLHCHDEFCPSIIAIAAWK